MWMPQVRLDRLKGQLYLGPASWTSAPCWPAAAGEPVSGQLDFQLWSEFEGQARQTCWRLATTI
jgi:hypothetical protein